MKRLLLFHQDLAQSPNLIEGRLLYLDTERHLLLDRFIATSGLPNFQSSNHLSVTGKGAIPPQYETKNDRYRVKTAPIDLKNVAGVSGYFYPILPFSVIINGKSRGDFGIHYDANVPGSSGCIVIRTQIGWTAFKNWMGHLAKSGIKEIDLLISYAR